MIHYVWYTNYSYTGKTELIKIYLIETIANVLIGFEYFIMTSIIHKEKYE